MLRLRRAHLASLLPLVLGALAASAAACGSSDGAPTDGDAGALDATTSRADGGDAAWPGVDGVAPGTDGSSGGGDDASAPDAPADLDAAIPAFAVGVTTRNWVDTTRGTPANGSEPAKTSRTLTTEIWYPSPGTGDGTSSTRDAPVASGTFPVVLFVHGSSSGRTYYSYLTQGLASAGYVVAAADFPLTAMSTPGGSSDLGVAAQVGDLSYLADQLGLASSNAGDAFHGAIDASAYVVVGHSTGGAVAELAAWAGDDPQVTHDARVRAIVPLSGDACMFGAPFFKTRVVPSLVVGGSDDLFVRETNSGRWVFENSNPPHVLATIVGGSHVYFTDVNLPDWLLSPVPTGPTSPLATTLSAYGDASACTPIPDAGSDPNIAFATQHALTIKLVASYLEQELRGRPGPMAALLAAHDPALVFEQ